MARLALSTAIVVACLVFYVPNHFVSGECCGPVLYCRNSFLFGKVCGYCADGTNPTPYCGKGPCNIFGCNCEGGCIVPKGKLVALQEDKVEQQNTTVERIAAHSKSHVDHLDIKEAYELVRNATHGANYTGKLEDFSPIFKKADKDGNGMITFEEIDQLEP